MHYKPSLEAAKPGPTLRTLADIVNHLYPELAGLQHEEFHVLCFDSENVLVKHFRAVTVDTATFDTRDLVSSILDIPEAATFVLAHNHLRKSPVATVGEKQFRRRLARDLNEMGVSLRDHVVFGGKGVGWSLKLNRTFPLLPKPT